MNDESKLTRRTVMKSAVAGAAAAACAPIVAAAGGDDDPLVVGQGAHRYKIQHDWAKLPDTHAFGNTHGVAVDRSGRVHIKHTVHASSGSPDAICIFDPEGKFIRSWGGEFRGGAHGLTLNTEPDGEYLYLCDCNRGVVRKTSLEGETVLDLAWPKGSGLYDGIEQYKPTNVAIVPHDARDGGGKPHAQAGHIFVADGYGKSWIHEYDGKGGYIRSFGGPGKERGQVSCPHGITIDARGGLRLLVADRGNRRLQYFSLDGRHLGFVTDELRMPCHFDRRGDVLLVPDLEARVTLLDKDNKLIAHLGDGENFKLRDKPREQFIAGKFIAPHSACFDANGNIFVVEWVEVGRVTKLAKIT